MSEERIPVLANAPDKGSAEPAVIGFVEAAVIKRVVLEVYKRERKREWEEFKAGCGRTAPAPDSVDRINAASRVLFRKFQEAVRKLVHRVNEGPFPLRRDLWEALAKVKSLLPPKEGGGSEPAEESQAVLNAQSGYVEWDQVNKRFRIGTTEDSPDLRKAAERVVHTLTGNGWGKKLIHSINDLHDALEADSE